MSNLVLAFISLLSIPTFADSTVEILTGQSAEISVSAGKTMVVCKGQLQAKPYRLCRCENLNETLSSPVLATARIIDENNLSVLQERSELFRFEGSSAFMNTSDCRQFIFSSPLCQNAGPSSQE